MNNDLEEMQEKAEVAYFNVLSSNLLAGIEGYPKNISGEQFFC